MNWLKKSNNSTFEFTDREIEQLKKLNRIEKKERLFYVLATLVLLILTGFLLG
jgi:hypothetical protein